MPAILARLAPRLQFEFILEPEFGVVGYVRFRNGRKSFFWHNKFNLNPVSSARIAQDKGYTTFFLRQLGFSVPRTATFFRENFRAAVRSARGIEQAIEHAEAAGWPIYVKPCRRSGGDGIELVHDAEGLRAAAARIFARDRMLLLQEPCSGRDYRVVVLDGEVISAYERVPLTVTGDGAATVRQLLVSKQEEFVRINRDTCIDFEDPRLAATLGRQGLRWDDVPAAGETVRLLDVANLSGGGVSVDITAQLHPSVADVAVRAAAALDLRFAGVDLLCADAMLPLGRHVVLEVNSAPGLDHYAGHGPAHEAHIDELYLRVLRAIESGPPE